MDNRHSTIVEEQRARAVPKESVFPISNPYTEANFVERSEWAPLKGILFSDGFFAESKETADRHLVDCMRNGVMLDWWRESHEVTVAVQRSNYKWTSDAYPISRPYTTAEFADLQQGIVFNDGFHAWSILQADKHLIDCMRSGKRLLWWLPINDSF